MRDRDVPFRGRKVSHDELAFFKRLEGIVYYLNTLLEGGWTDYTKRRTEGDVALDALEAATVDVSLIFSGDMHTRTVVAAEIREIIRKRMDSAK